MNPQTKKLVMVDPGGNNNKYYNMFFTGGDTFNVEYGRVGSGKQTETYPISKWDTKYREKIKKGYKDHTDLFIEEAVQPVVTSTGEIKEDLQILRDLYGFANQSVRDNYTVSSESVTKKQVEKAQSIIDETSTNIDVFDLSLFNQKLVELFAVIPRRMRSVNDYLLKNDTKDEKSQLLTREQSIIDTMMGQVSLNQQNKVYAAAPSVSLAEKLGITISQVVEASVIDKIKNLMGDSRNLFYAAYEVSHPKTRDVLNRWVDEAKDKKTELLWHGSRNQNWFNILQTGMLIRPAGAIVTGGMFGGRAIYWANKAKKSIGYTSLNGSYWARGSDNRAFLSLFDVHLGNQYHIHKWQRDHQNLDRDRLLSYGPYDSVYAHGGYDLINDEFIVYTTNQCSIRYLVEIRG